MIYQLTHNSTYDYAGSVARSQQLLRLTPRTTASQRCSEQRIKIDPSPSELSEYEDYFGNPTMFANVDLMHDTLTVKASSRVVVDQDHRRFLDPGPGWERLRDALSSDRTAEGLQAYQYVWESPMVPVHARLRDYAMSSFTPGRPMIEACADLNERIYHEFEYDPKSTTISTPVSQVYQQRAGVCQDFAHVMISSLRSLGLAARYVSGYVRPISSDPAPPPHPTPADAEESQQPKRQAVESPQTTAAEPEENRGAAASHAWVSVFVGDAGWIDFDPTNRARPGHMKTDHITLGWGRDYADVAPIKGVTLGGGAHTINVDVVIKEA